MISFVASFPSVLLYNHMLLETISLWKAIVTLSSDHPFKNFKTNQEIRVGLAEPETIPVAQNRSLNTFLALISYSIHTP